MTNSELAAIPEGHGSDLTNLSMQQIFWLGAQMIQTGMFGSGKNAQAAAAKIMAGQALGLDPVTALRGIYTIGETFSFRADLMAGRVKAHPKYDYQVVKLDNTICELAFFEVVAGKRVQVGVSTFTVEDAKRQGTRNMDRFPRNMLFARALSNGVSFYCPDVKQGMPVEGDEEFEGQVIIEKTPEEEAAELEAAAERLAKSRKKAANAGQKGLKLSETPPEAAETTPEPEPSNVTPDGPEASQTAPNEPTEAAPVESDPRPTEPETINADEPFGDGPGGDLHTDAQRKKIMAMLNEKGFTQDNEKRQVVAGILGLSNIVSFKTVTFDQASVLIESLDAPTATPEALRGMFITEQANAA